MSVWSDAVTNMPEDYADGIVIIGHSDVGKVIPGRFEIPLRGRKQKEVIMVEPKCRSTLQVNGGLL